MYCLQDLFFVFHNYFNERSNQYWHTSEWYILVICKQVGLKSISLTSGLNVFSMQGCIVLSRKVSRKLKMIFYNSCQPLEVLCCLSRQYLPTRKIYKTDESVVLQTT